MVIQVAVTITKEQLCDWIDEVDGFFEFAEGDYHVIFKESQGAKLCIVKRTNVNMSLVLEMYNLAPQNDTHYGWFLSEFFIMPGTEFPSFTHGNTYNHGLVIVNADHEDGHDLGVGMILFSNIP